MIPDIKVGDSLVCPICGKEFKATEDTKYIIGNEYTCCWKCFLTKALEPRETKKKRG